MKDEVFDAHLPLCTHGILGNVFANPTASSSAPYPQESNPWSSNVSEHTSPHVTSECQNLDITLDPSCQPRPSVRNSSTPWKEDFLRIMGRPTETADFGTSLWQTPYTNNICLLEDKIQNWGMYLFTISYGSYAVDQRSGNGWISGWSQIFALYQRNSWSRLWVTWRENCFNTEQKHPEYPLQEKGQSGGNERSKRRPLPPRKTDRSPDLRVHLGHWSQRFCRELCRPMYSCSSKWRYSGIRLQVGNIFIFCDAKSHLMKFLKACTKWEHECLRNSRPYWNCTIWRFIRKPDLYHKLKTMVKTSIEQEIRNKNFGARNGNFEKNAVVKNQGTRQRAQRSLGDCWQWKANGQCSKRDNCSFQHDQDKRARTTQPNPSPRSSTQQGVQNASRTRSSRSRSPSGKMARLPCKDSKKNGDKSAVAMLKITRHLVCVFQDTEPPKSTTILRKSSNTLKTIRCVRFTKAVVRHADIRDQNPPLGYICPSHPHQRNPNAPKFGDRSQEETEWQERCAREAAWKLAKNVFKLKEHQRATFFSPSENWCLPAPPTLEPEERGFVVDSGASMHMISKKDWNTAELETVTTSRSPTTDKTANGELQTNVEATVYVKELDIFLTKKLVEDTPAVLSLVKLCDEHGYSYEWINGQIRPVFGNSAIKRTSLRSWFLVHPRFLPQACLPQHPWHLQGRKLIVYLTTHNTFNCVKPKCG